METFLLVLRALLDADIEIAGAQYNAVLLGPRSHRIELRLDNPADVDRVVDETRKLGLDPVVLTPSEGAHFAITIAIDGTPHP
jgi:hypothetical protein